MFSNNSMKGSCQEHPKSIFTNNVTNRCMENLSYLSIFLKCHSDQNLRTRCFCIFLIYQWFLLTFPNRSAVRVREGRFFRLFLSRFFGRHYSNTFPRITSIGREFTGCDVKQVAREMHVALQNFASLIQPFEISNAVLQQQ